MKEKLDAIYNDYIEEMTRDKRANGQTVGSLFGAVMFGTKESEYMSRRFTAAMEKFMAEFAAASPGHAEAVELADYILARSLEYREKPALNLMLTAMHSQLLPYVGLLTREDAVRYIRLYDDNFPPKERTPVMKKLYKELKKV